tara:strand:+ start:6051 stop:6665 length:615 start_codon:yes stop_codon:yes gene_type:complete
MITTLTTFQTGRFKIPNAVAAPLGADYTVDIQESIDLYERRILIDALGFDLYELVADDYPLTGGEPANIIDLINGKNYTKDGVTVCWEGLLSSPLLPAYVYYQFLRDKQDIFTTMGVERPEAVNSVPVSSNERSTRAYIEFLEAYQGGHNTNPNIIHTSLGVGIDWMVGSNHLVSLYQYLEDNASDYPEKGVFTLHPSINTFGI